jgi:hypothetical protein
MGAGLALELAARGRRVDLYEKRDRIHGEASLANEGKIHLGYIYANDPSLRTARQMVAGAWSFSTIVAEWLQVEPAALPRSGPFHYLVHRHSLLAPDELAAIYARIATLDAEAATRSGASYLGMEAAAARPPRRLSDRDCRARFGSDIAAAFETGEVAVDSEAIGAALSARVLAEPQVTVHFDSEVTAMKPRADAVELQLAGDPGVRRYDHAVNASWEGLLRLDATAGVPPPPGASFRWRWTFRLRAPRGGASLPSTSIVLGAYGDVVRYQGGDVFLSWYPAGRRGRSEALALPPEWSRRPLPPDDVETVRAQAVAALSALVPELGAVEPATVAAAEVYAGVIYARGEQDISDPASGYHQRHAIGPRSFGRYHTVDTGKYTTAPMFARQLAEQLDAALRHGG